jgi:hypothetical protein
MVLFPPFRFSLMRRELARDAMGFGFDFAKEIWPRPHEEHELTRP